MGPQDTYTSKTIKNLLTRTLFFYWIKPTQPLSVCHETVDLACVFLWISLRQAQILFVLIWQGQKYTFTFYPWVTLTLLISSYNLIILVFPKILTDPVYV